MPNPKYLKQTDGVKSEEAAALFLTDGRTSDAKIANRAAEVDNQMGVEGFYFDMLDRDNLRRLMGFDFDIKFKGKKIKAYSTQEPFVFHEVRYSGIDDAKSVEKAVEACITLKELYEETKQEIEDAKND